MSKRNSGQQDEVQMNETNGESEGSMIVSSVYTSKTYDDVN